MSRPTSSPRPAPRRGATLIEILISMSIMALLIVGILQMFILSLSLNMSAAWRTQYTMKAQQVAEQIKYLSYMYNMYGSTQVPTGSGVPIPISTGNGTTTNLPYTSSDPNYAYWGPQGANVVEHDEMPFRLSYSILSDNTSQTQIVTVVANQALVQQGSTSASINVGAGVAVRKVTYVFQVK